MRVFAISALLILSAVAINAQTAAKYNFQVRVDSCMGTTIFPSWVLFYSEMMSMDKEEGDAFDFSVDSIEPNTTLRLIVEETKFNKKTIYQQNLQKGGSYVFSPYINWKYDALRQLDQPTLESYAFILELNGKEIDRRNMKFSFRGINECMFGYYEDDGSFVDLCELFAQYVNEDHPLIDKILREVLEVDKTRRFIGYQGSWDDVMEQVFWIWEYFCKRGTRYSDIMSSSVASGKITSQYVRFFEQVVNNRQANCVDGTVMLASIFQKIGLETAIISMPSHMLLAICNTWKKENEDGYYIFLETTMMGTDKDSRKSFNAALDAGAKMVNKYLDDKEKGKMEGKGKGKAYVANISTCRRNGIKPIGR